MKLERGHRKALVFRLEKVCEEIELNKKGLEKAGDDLKDSYDIDIFLLEKQKELIEHSLIDNDIDY